METDLDITNLSTIADCILAVMAIIAGIVSLIEYSSHKKKENNKLFSQLNKRYEKNRNIQTVVRYLRDKEASDKEPCLYQLEIFLRFFEELGLYMETKSINKARVNNFFGYYLRQLYKTKRGRFLIYKLGKKEEQNLKLLQIVKQKLGITMKEFSQHATRLVISFVSKKENERVEWEITEIPCANYESETIRGSENYNEVEFTPFDDGDTYLVVLSVNQEKGDLSLYNENTDEEINDFEIKEFFDEDDECE
jgi:hypothetical protein